MEQNNISMELTNRFPEHGSQISQLLLKNQAFREIAEDYEFCRQKLIRLSENPIENHPLIGHYEKTMLELEEEIMEYLTI
jgi:uncharacterized protein YdcH (DUF465 family)